MRTLPNPPAKCSRLPAPASSPLLRLTTVVATRFCVRPLESDSSATLPTVSLAQVLLTLDLSATLPTVSPALALPTANPETLLLMLDLGSMPLLTLDLSATLLTVSPELVLTLAR
ncbi:hypothetical protein PF005_g2814 [Phytophthora fragariae]|uniref:Uncharacterized protein n=1 Tax=Phytophthora fragariae TaxID=53985 RepID=A0A6A3TF61_9STRA|nr:hypothetical protein PF003_g4843 [Phytophthora fragariae]KAE8947251.1 hypothetical protein PF009_g3124 [Phytophthora fragariae]KAE9007752.1 hypothetical protein PF011_g10992 [Phytophthora fragariae]KAE9134902.1 hypothetical protein PF007_g2768 [Phytophthora fragariae]KAE9153553.1 hypothetical protein PF006_g2321 [Phytophthora fragariae]